MLPALTARAAPRLAPRPAVVSMQGPRMLTLRSASTRPPHVDPRRSRPPKKRDEPPASVVNFRNMQRRRGDAFRTNIRVPRNAPVSASGRLRDHWFGTAEQIMSCAKQDTLSAIERYKQAEALLAKRSAEWRALARTLPLDSSAVQSSAQLGVPAYNHVIALAIRAASPSAAWHLFCDMKRQGLRPTPRTFSNMFHAMVSMVHAQQLETLSTPLWHERLAKMYEGLGQAHAAAARWQVHPEERMALLSRRSAADYAPSTVAAAYRAYMALELALGRATEAMAAFDAVCPDNYPGAFADDDDTRLPRAVFATVDLYTAVMHGLARAPLPPQQKSELVRLVWHRWQDDILQGHRRGALALLDAKAVRGIVWAFSQSQEPKDVAEVCAMLGRYLGVPFPTTPGAKSYTTTGTPVVPFKDPVLLMDVLRFFFRRRAYHAVLDVCAHAKQTFADGLAALPAATDLEAQARLRLSRLSSRVTQPKA